MAARMIMAARYPAAEPEDYELTKARESEKRMSSRARAQGSRPGRRRRSSAQAAALLAEFRSVRLRDARKSLSSASSRPPKPPKPTEADRERRQAEYLADVADRELAKPHVADLAIALSRAHEGGRPVKLAALMIECGLAAGPDDAARLVKGLVGKELCANLEACGWVHVGRQGHRLWKPPLADRARV